MVEISFYHLLHGETEKVAAKLLEKILSADMRVVVYAETTEKIDFLNSYFWTFSQSTFLPHGSAKEGMAEHQPVWLTSTFENPNQAKVLMALDHIDIKDFENFEKCLDIFNANDSHSRTLAEGRLKAYKEAGHHITYWQQDAQGKWVKQELD
jgi:DNA polymerase-3 subunit chi